MPWFPLKKWWLTQASMDIARDDDLLELMQESGCIGIFFGIESFGTESLEDATKPRTKSTSMGRASVRCTNGAFA